MRNLVHCPVCQSMYSAEHGHCPFCGSRKPSVTLKYLVYGLLAIGVFVLLVYLILSSQM